MTIAGSSDQLARISVFAQITQLSQQPLKCFLPDAVDGHDQIPHLAHVRVVIDVFFDSFMRFSDLFFDMA